LYRHFKKDGIMTEFNLKIGLQAEKSEKVTALNTAKAYGSGSIEVYATPAMLGLMEGASLASVDPLLPKEFSTVGTQLNVAHLSATPLGMSVTAKAELLEITGKKLVFKVTAFDERGKIGEGRHERAIIQIDKFLARAQEK
jgi:predicted thioesterase